MDEATLRVVVQGEGGVPQRPLTPAAPTPPAAPPRPAPAAAPPAQDPMKAALEAQARNMQQAALEAATAAERAKHEAEEKREEAKRQRDERRQQREAERNKPFDPVAEATKQIEAQRRRMQVKAAVLNITEGPAAAIPAQQKQEAKSRFDAILDIADMFRGTLGGAFGKIIGSVLDAVSAFRKMREAAEKPAVAAPPRLPPVAAPPALPASAPPAAAAAAPGRPAQPTGPAPQPAATPTTRTPASAAAPNAPGGSLASAAPYIAVGLAVLVAFKVLADVVGSATKAVVSFAAKVVSPSADPSQMVETIGSAVTKVSGALTFIIPPLGIFGSAIGGAIEALGGFMRAMDGMVARYAGFNPALAQGFAQAQVTQVLNDMRRAQEATPALLQYLKVRTELQQRFEDAKIRFLTRMMPAVVKGMEIAEKLLPLVELIVGLIEIVASILPESDSKLADIEKNSRPKPPEGKSSPGNLLMQDEMPFIFRPGQ